MNWSSLRLRLLVGGLAAIAAALVAAGDGLTILFARHVKRTIGEELDVHLKQLLAGVDTDAGGNLIVARAPVDPRFSEPLSGLYWQVSTDSGQIIRSRSLWDTTLALPPDELLPGAMHEHEGDGPAKSRVLIVERKISLTSTGSVRPVQFAAATDLARVTRATATFTADLARALVLLAIALTLATTVQVYLGLRPLTLLRRSIAEVRQGRSPRLSSVVPSEVAPLVDELNALLQGQELEIERSRGRAADLAHGLKTPLAALSADVARLRDRGQSEIADEIERAGAAMNRHVDRELARARIRGLAKATLGAATELVPLVRSLLATLTRTPAGERIAFEMQIGGGLRVPMDRTDLAEVLGNLIDNAARHAASKVRVSALSNENAITIRVDDDGPGIAEDARAAMLERGTQLDQRGGAAGLGLAIVRDVLDAYGWQMTLATSDLGGLGVVLTASATQPRI